MPEIKTVHKGEMLFESRMGNHALAIDVPEGMGGRDRGPQPPQLFIASLGSCVAALVADYCNHHDISAEGLEVTVSFDKAEHPTHLTNIRALVMLPHADLGQGHRETVLRRVAEHCPVHETLCAGERMDFDIRGRD